MLPIWILTLLVVLLVVLLIGLGKKSVKPLPWILGIWNVAFTLCVFATAYEAQNDVCLLLVAFLDFPASFVAMYAIARLDDMLPDLYLNRTHDLIYTCMICLPVGFFWFFCIGVALRRFITKQSLPGDGRA